MPDFNRRFSVRPAQQESAFVKLAGIELELVLASKYARVVRNDNTVAFQGMVLQLPRLPLPRAFRALCGDRA